MRRFTQLVALMMMMAPAFLVAQTIAQKEAASLFLQENYEELGLTKADVTDVVITDLYQTKHNGMTHVYFAQTHNGVQVHNGLFNITVKADNSIMHHGNRFVYDLQSKVTSDKNSLTASEAVMAVADNLGVSLASAPVATKSSDNISVFNVSDLGSGNINVQPRIYKVNEVDYRLAHKVDLMQAGSVDSWIMHIDANTGEVIGKQNMTLKCTIAPGAYHNHTRGCYGHAEQTTKAVQKTKSVAAALRGDGSSYNALGLPIESPVHGSFAQIEDPSLEIASPYGWHDVDGVEGAEFNYTRGNNVHAFEDSAQQGVSIGNEPDGGDDLQFTFPYDANLNAFDNMEADVTNTFYATNAVHDIMYLLGFDEAAGNFQNNNYGNGGQGNDDISAQTLDGAAANNATWAGGGAADGTQPVMTLGIWDNTASLFRVLSPSNVAADYETSFGATDTWGGEEPEDVDVRGEMVVVADSNPQSPQQGCGELITDVNGKIAVIYRGLCEFGQKALNAQNAGAVAAVICNVPGVNGGDGETAMGMDGGTFGLEVTIPTISLAFSDCNRIVAEMDNGPVMGELNIPDISGPTELSTGLDNGVIAHEIGHGVSQRLIGGPSNGGCVNNGENLGDGIADFMTLIMTVEEGDQGADARGIGAYVIGQPATGRGIRNFPYSTDFNVNPHVYDNIKGETDPHPIGEVMVAMLWDVYWAFVDLYGFDPDWSNTESGNHRASRVVVDAFKLSPCDPGFVDLRDAIFAADEFEHECMLWDIFARRGLGVNADQGSSEDASDGTQDFEPLATCTPTLKIKREVPQLAVAGEEMNINISIANHTLETAVGVIVTEVLEEGLTLGTAPDNITTTVDGNNIMFEIGDMASLDEREFSYTVVTDENQFSQTLWFNGAETTAEQGIWQRDFVEGNNFWSLSPLDPRTGTQAWFVQEEDAETDQRLILPNYTVVGERPTFRFWHRINTTEIENGGFVEISNDGGITWLILEDEIFLGGYPAILTYTNFAIPNLRAYSGNSPMGAYEAGYIDLRNYVGQEISLRFRFGTYDIDDMVPITFGQQEGWFIDDAEFMDLKSYITSGNISSENAGTEATEESETIVDSKGTVGVDDLSLDGVNVSLFPNPASKRVTVGITSEKQLDADISIMSMEGKVLATQSANINKAENFINLNLGNYSPGFYLVQVRSGDRLTIKKLIIE